VLKEKGVKQIGVKQELGIVTSINKLKHTCTHVIKASNWQWVRT